MPNLAAFGAKLAALEAKLPGIVEQLGVNPALKRLFNLSVHDAAGAAAGEHLTPQMIERLSAAPVVMRRRSLTDVLGGGELQTVHTSGRTGAAAGAKRSIEAREHLEPSLFGDHPTYGHLSEDPLAPTRTPLEIYYPRTGNSTVLRPSAMIAQYGRYGLVPRDKSKLTYTIGDSLDQSKWHPVSDKLGELQLYGAHQEDSALGALASHFKEARATRADELGLMPDTYGSYVLKPEHSEGLDYSSVWDKTNALTKQLNSELPEFSKAINMHGLSGIKDMGHNSMYDSYSRLLPRKFGEQGLPLSPWEEVHVPDIPKFLNGNPGIGYVETQGHGLTAQDIGKVYDYGINPSSAMEKKLGKLGIEYEPVVSPDSHLSQIHDFLKSGERSRNDLADFIDELGPSANGHTARSVADSLRSMKIDPMNLPKIEDHYNSGGSV